MADEEAKTAAELAFWTARNDYLTDQIGWDLFPGASELIRRSEARRNVWWRRALRWIGSFGE